jgi:hypothetical protein
MTHGQQNIKFIFTSNGSMFTFKHTTNLLLFQTVPLQNEAFTSTWDELLYSLKLEILLHC